MAPLDLTRLGQDRDSLLHLHLYLRVGRDNGNLGNIGQSNYMYIVHVQVVQVLHVHVCTTLCVCVCVCVCEVRFSAYLVKNRLKTVFVVTMQIMLRKNLRVISYILYGVLLYRQIVPQLLIIYMYILLGAFSVQTYSNRYCNNADIQTAVRRRAIIRG